MVRVRIFFLLRSFFSLGGRTGSVSSLSREGGGGEWISSPPDGDVPSPGRTPSANLTFLRAQPPCILRTEVIEVLVMTQLLREVLEVLVMTQLLRDVGGASDDAIVKRGVGGASDDAIAKIGVALIFRLL